MSPPRGKKGAAVAQLAQPAGKKYSLCLFVIAATFCVFKILNVIVVSTTACHLLNTGKNISVSKLQNIVLQIGSAGRAGTADLVTVCVCENTGPI